MVTIQSTPDLSEKLRLVSGETAFECEEDAGCGGPGLRSQNVSRVNGLFVYHAKMPGGKTFPLLKTMLSTSCLNNCNYCGMRDGRDFRRASFTPDEMARVFLQMSRAGLVDGLFLSSGVVKNGAFIQNRLIDTVEILRKKLGYRGFVHLKIIPGAEKGQVLRAMELADRVSINLEAPNPTRLKVLSGCKQFEEQLLAPLKWIDEIRTTLPPERGWKGRWPSSITQFVAGVAGESDLELLHTSAYLMNQLHLARTYYSGFTPIPQTPLEDRPGINPVRQNRLYQASFLIRDYGFILEDMPFQPDGCLPLEMDPKLCWAKTNLTDRPVEILTADLYNLMKIPGIGPKCARAIIEARRIGTLRGLGDLRRLGVSINRAAPYLLINGRGGYVQETLWKMDQ
jgi:predicted DNA-binding helix-hairpin-helix protein